MHYNIHIHLQTRSSDLLFNSFSRIMGHGEEHGHGKINIPDYRQWKIEGTPLQEVQEKLARKGLKDPWLR